MCAGNIKKIVKLDYFGLRKDLINNYLIMTIFEIHSVIDYNSNSPLIVQVHWPDVRRLLPSTDQGNLEILD